MPSYKVLVKSYIGNAIREEGEVVEYDGDVADNLEALEAPAPVSSSKGKKASPSSDLA